MEELFSKSLSTSSRQVLLKMDDDKYFADPNISNSDLKVFLREGAMAFWWYKYTDEGKKEATNNMAFGTFIHTVILEPEEYVSRYRTFSGKSPNSPQKHKFCDLLAKGMFAEEAYVQIYSTKGQKADEIRKNAANLYDELCSYLSMLGEMHALEAAGTPVKLLSLDDVKRGEILFENYMAHPFVHKMANLRAYNEHVIKWRWKFGDGRRPVSFDSKGKIDNLSVDHAEKVVWHIDLKTTKNAGKDAFRASVDYWGYDNQAAYYRRGIFDAGVMEQIAEEGYELRTVLVALQSEPPYTVNVFPVGIPTVKKALARVEDGLFAMDQRMRMGDPRVQSNWTQTLEEIEEWTV